MFDSLLKFSGRKKKKRSSSSSDSSLTFARLERRDLRASFYVDAISGDDANPGTADQPFATYLPVVWAYDQADGANIGTVQLQPGDELVFREGTYSATFQNPSDRNTGIHRGLYLRGLNGTAENPIVVRAEPGAVINPSPADGSEHFSVQIDQSEHVVFSGFEITGLGTGVFVSESSDIEITNNWIHDIDGAAIDNLSGVMLTANDGLIEVHGNLFNDIYDRGNGASENSRAFVAFGNEGADVRVFNNTLFNSVPIDSGFGSGGIVTKHGSDSSFSVHHNVFYQVRDEAIGTSNPNSTIDHNLILSSDGVSVRDLGGPAFFNDILIEQNTFVKADHALKYNPTDVWYGAIDAYDDIGELSFLNNLVEHTGLLADDQGAIAIGLGPRTDAALVDKILEDGNLDFDGNIYSHTDEEFRAVLFSYVEGRRLGQSFEDWQAEGYDINGRELDLAFDQLFRSQNEQASQAGWFAGEESRLTLYALNSDGGVDIAPQIAAGESQTFALVRSGDDATRLNEPLTVSLNVSADNLEIPTTVTFQPGETKLQFQVLARTGDNGGERAVRVSADANGTEFNVDAWVRITESTGDVDPVSPGGGDPVVLIPDNEELGFQNGVLSLPADSADSLGLDFQWLQRFAEYDNELGFFLVDDATGTVDGVQTGNADYAATALSHSSRQVIFNSGEGAGAQSQFNVPAGSHLAFYLIQNATTDRFISENAANSIQGNPVAFFSVAESNPDDFDHVRVEETGEGLWRFGWEDLVNGGDFSFTDAVLSLQVVESDVESNEARVDDLASELIAEFGLQPSQIDFFNWGDREERWVRGNENWYFITPEGSLFAWDGSQPNNLTGELVATLDQRYHDNIFLFDQSENFNESPDLQLPSQFAGSLPAEINLGDEVQFQVIVADDQPLAELEFEVAVNGQAVQENGPSIDSQGIFRWTPTQVAENSIEITVRDPAGLSDAAGFLLRVSENQPSEILVQENFEDDSMDGFDDVFATGGGDWRIAEDDFQQDTLGNGNKSLEITFPNNESGAQAAINDLQDARSIDVGYSVRLPEGIATGSDPSNLFASVNQSRIWSGISGELGLASYLQYSQESADSAGAWEYLFTYGVEGENVRFHRIPVAAPISDYLEINYFVQWNSDGNEDGVFMAWINDELVVEERDVVWSLSDSNPEGIWVGGHYSGAELASPARQLTDEIRIRTKSNKIITSTNLNPTVFASKPFQSPSGTKN